MSLNNLNIPEEGKANINIKVLTTKNFNNSSKNFIFSKQKIENNNNWIQQDISFENEIFNSEIFYDGNSDNYDMILNFESFEQLKKDGWNAYFSQEGFEKYEESIHNENIIIGVVGIKNRGKSYLLKRIMNSENYKSNHGFLVSTHGISCSFPVL